MSDVKERLENTMTKLGTQYAGLLVNPQLKEMKHRLERTFTHREIDHEATDLSREIKEIEDVNKLIDDAVAGTISILEEKLKIDVAYIQTEDGLQHAPVKGLAAQYINFVNS